MAAAARSALRLSGLSSRMAASAMPKPPARFTTAAARRAFTVSAQRPKKSSEVIKETEVPVSVYQPDSKGVAMGNSDHYSIPVKGTSRAAVAEPPIGEEDEPVVPLTEQVYAQMPATMQKLSVFGKVIIITGGARGLGNYMARACAEAGAKAIAIFDANQDLGDESAAELHQKTGMPITFFKVDVRDGAAINAAVESVVELYGAPDVLVNSAGIADSNIKAETYDPAMFRRLIDINLTGSFLMSQAVGRAMMAANKPGSIILVASMSGSIVNYPQEQSCYNASKAGVIQLGKSLAAEWAKYQIRVNCISPGYMDTALNKVPALDAQKKIWKSMTPQERLGNVDDLNGLCVFLASDSSGFMTGSNVIIDGGYTVL
ncbi:D-arabinitol 2-dehydrogenase [Gaeumannomyces tritici R3-111a-1]|uniref:D-arabinitol 2-dehydrogenase n=1 Tax=Gaeumannomyces tritici (strain R3-111a-1) TaxID=644352 RepID=J3NI01_GAET3|nr:D-arabinitol 2-dehydrogenase [Gaeumannomyces tritici R3-111a-1]EJT80894.1 D-arabinitol 2-dehydrogenase [Gaeumannomyces tritici R3-111a-1]